MKPRSLLAVAGAVGGEPVDADDVGISSVQTDSRLVGAGALFVALVGEHADGHAFVGDAFDHGATAALVRSGFVVNGPAVLVPHTGQALLDLAADERRGFAGTVVAITGANGKTSTKDMAAAVCAERFRTHASPRSFNNEVGLPMTLLGASPDTEVVIAELGARHVGDVQRLMPIADPSIAVVTNVGVAHMEVFGSWEAIVDASAEPIEALDEEDLAILNVDDAVASTFADRTRARVRSFGRGADAAVGLELDVPLAACASALSAARITPWRMETTATARGVRVVNDAYNANPESVAAALKTARWMAADGRLIAVLGQMAELGAIAAEEHERVGELAARLHVDRLITIGPEAKAIAVAGVREGVEPENVADYDDADDALTDVLAAARSGDVVLIKGSRVAGLEQLAARLVEALS